MYITVNKKTVIFRSKTLTVYTGPLPQLYGSFLHIFQFKSFQIIILQTFLIAIIMRALASSLWHKIDALQTLVPCNTLTHSTNEDILNIKRKVDPEILYPLVYVRNN